MNAKKLFPVLSLNPNITNSIKKIISADISSAVHSGLNNEIQYSDTDCGINTPAKIIEDPITKKCIVILSAAYCQYLWLLCDVVLKWIDYNLMKDACNSHNLSMSDLSGQFKKANVDYETIQRLYGYEFARKYLEFAESVKDFIVDPNFTNKIEKEFSHALILTNGSDKINPEEFYCYNINSPYELKVNSVYCYGIAFILLHEAAHFQLGHNMFETGSMQQEIDADESAIWSIINDLENNDRFTAICGILLMLFSLILLDPSLEEDGIHPRDDIRLFSMYDKIKDENIKYRLLIIGLFILYSENDPNFPKDLTNSDETIRRIQNYLKEKCNSSTNVESM